MKNTYISGTGSYLPSQILTNDELSKRIDTSDEWIFSRTGIKERHISSDQETASMMGTAAAKQALAAANLKPEQIDMIIVATCTPDQVFPSTACLIQRNLDMPSIPAFDIQAACSGFIYGMDFANKCISFGNAKHILVVGSEVMSRTVNWDDRSTCVLFGDGAGAVILSSRDEPGIVWTKLGANGKYAELLYYDNFIHQADRSACYMHLSGNEVFKVAVKTLEQIAQNALDENNLSKGEIDWLIPHQANVRIIQAMAKRLGVPMENVILTLAEHANTSAASIPLALDYGVREGLVQRGQLLLLEAFGAGFTWGAALVRY
ncbi:MAG: beta-ketoacyl-ACP synthase III [Gammaproteobacteria bacterium]